MITENIKDDIVCLLKQCQFRTLCDKYFAEKFHWVIKGSSVLSGEYKDKEIFFNKVIGRLSNVVKGDWKMHIHGVYVDGDTLIIEMCGEVKTNNGADYNNDYCWIFQFQDAKVVKLTAYYDSLLVNKTLQENE